MKHSATFKVAFVLSLAALTFVSYAFREVSNVNIQNKTAKDTSDSVYDAIIVPGLPFENGKWSTSLKLRVFWAYELYSKGKAKNVIFSGSAVHSPYVEARIMAMYGEALGINKDHIYIEDKAEHSTENVYFSYKIAQQQKFSKVALATDPFQLSALKSFIKMRRYKIDYLPAPANWQTVFAMDSLADPEINYKEAYVKDFIPLEQRQSGFRRMLGASGLLMPGDQDGK